MHIVAILNQKGGAGKTTLATHLARAFQLTDQKVLLIDSDPQGSARDWAAINEAQLVSTVGIDRPTIERDIKSIAPVDWVFIDGAPQAQDLAASAVKAAHFVLIPVQPSPFDIWATEALVDVVHQRMQITDGKLQAAFVISRAIKGTRIGQELREALSGYNLPILESIITQRVLYPMAAAKGSTVLDEEPKGEAAREVRLLAAELKARIENLSK